MAKVSFTKLALKKKDDIKTVTINEQPIEVKQYLPISEKVDLISRIINESQDDSNHFVNPVKVELLITLEIIFSYTNLSFTDKQKEDGMKLYDLLTENGVGQIIMDTIPKEEKDFVIESVWDSIDSIYTYSNSAMGLLENIRNNYDQLNFDTTTIQKALADPENLTLLKNVMNKLG